MKSKKLQLVIVAFIFLDLFSYSLASDRGNINSGESKTSFEITGPSYLDTWTFQGTAGDRVIINAVKTSGDLDTTIYLYPPGGGPVEAETYNSYLGSIWGGDQLDHQLQQTGTYTIVIQDCLISRSGFYNLCFLKIPGTVSSSLDLDGGAIVSGETLSGTINVPSDLDAFQFYGTAGDRVIINAVKTSGDLDTTIYLYPPGGGPVEAETYNSYLGSIWGSDQLDHQLQQTGLYTIVIQDCLISRSGSYNVCFLKIPGTVSSSLDLDGGAIVSGETLNGTTNILSDLDAFQFYGSAGDRVIIGAVKTSGDLDTTIYLYPPGGGPVEAETYNSYLGSIWGDDQLDHQLQQTGLYTIVIQDCLISRCGSYNISLTKIPSDPRPGIYNPYPQNGAVVQELIGSFTWDPVAGATGYDLYFGEDPAEPLEQVGFNLPSASMPFPAMQIGIKYYWHVVAHDQFGGDIEGPYWWFWDNDTDNDGISDEIENASCTDPNDADTDDDGIADGSEDVNHNGTVDLGETNPCKIDTDGDAIQDGTEMGLTLTDIGPDTDTNIFQPDLDPGTVTDPLNADTDGDGLTDGEEDLNHNGRVDAGETDPNPRKAMPWIPLLLLE